MGGWQVQEVKQRFSEVVRRAVSEGPQVVTRHGEEVAVVIDIAEYRRLRGETADFGRFLPSEVAEEWGRLNAVRPLPTADGLIAATARVNGWTLVSRNIKDFEGTGVSVVNPFELPF